MQAEEVVLNQIVMPFHENQMIQYCIGNLMKSIHWVLVRKPSIHRLPFFSTSNGQASIGTIHTEDENNNQFMRQFEIYRKAALAGKYNYLNPKKSATVPGEYIKQVLMRGTGFVGGKGRVCKIFETEIDAGTRAKRIKKSIVRCRLAGRRTRAARI